MKKLIIILFAILGYSNIHAQGGNNSDFQVLSVSIVPFDLVIGEESDFIISVVNIGVDIPPNNVYVQMSVSDHVLLVDPLVEEYDCYGKPNPWQITYIDYPAGNNHNTTIVYKNMLDTMQDQMGCNLTIKFKAVTPTPPGCNICGVATVNSSFYGNFGDNNGYNNSVYGNFSVSTPLPIALGQFTAEAENCSAVDVKWTTYGENNVERMEVERSYDAKTFIKVGEVSSKGGDVAKAQNYAIKDVKGLVAGKVYYRLKTVDKDGSVSYSRLVSVLIACDDNPEMDIYPNPAHNMTTVTFAGIKSGEFMEVSLLNARGEEVRELKMDPHNPNNLDITGLPSGIYFLKVIDESLPMQKKFVKVN
ncbi:MAG: T9SS type A sorting domain-containing protein [Saprospiraceae bacterium]|nr:T9SS type A sorting domain-containing protein [Saprospiraceae bacterium]